MCMIPRCTKLEKMRKRLDLMAGPLSDVKILDLTTAVSGPSAMMLLADQGADVIKVESPNGGDLTRFSATSRGGFAASFLNNNRNKRSLAIDLKTEAGVRTFNELVSRADVVAQNFRPGVMERLGLSYDILSMINPGLVYLSITGFGHEGPFAHKPVYDPIIQALSGLTTVQGGSDEARPRLVRTILPDKLTGYVAAQAVTAALFSRERTGKGQHIRLAMLDVIVGFLWGSDMSGHTFVGDEPDRETPQSEIDLIYETQSDYITIAVQTDKQWLGLCKALDKQEWLSDPRFETYKLRSQNINTRLYLMQEVLLTNTAQHWLELLERHDVPSAPVLTRRAMIAHPQTQANDIIRYIDHPEAGKLRQTRPAATFSETAPQMRYPAPKLGEHSEEILREAGVDSDEIRQLLADSVIAVSKETP